MVKYPHVSVFRTLNRVLQKHCIQVVTPIVYSSIQFFRKSTGFFTAKDAWSFYKHCHFKRSTALWLFPLCFIQIDNILKRHFLTPRVLFCNVPNRFTQAMHKKTHFIVKRKLAYHVHLLFLMSSHKFVWEFNENFNRKKQERFVWVLIRVFRDIHYVADRKKVNRLWLPLE